MGEDEQRKAIKIAAVDSKKQFDMDSARIVSVTGENGQEALLKLRIRNLRLLPLFYMLPDVVVNATEFGGIPRNIYFVLTDKNTIAQIESDRFLLLMIDAVAFMIWPHLNVRGRIEDYSGYDPVYRLAHWLDTWYSVSLELGLDVAYLMDVKPPRQMPLLSYEESLRWFGFMVNLVMSRTNYREIIQEVCTHRCHEDFDKASFARADFERQWNHTRTKHPIVLTKDVPDEAVLWTDSVDEAIDMKAFCLSLPAVDRRIIELRNAGYKHHEIANMLRFQSASAVTKRIKRIIKRFEQFQNEYNSTNY